MAGMSDYEGIYLLELLRIFFYGLLKFGIGCLGASDGLLKDCADYLRCGILNFRGRVGMMVPGGDLVNVP